MSYSPRNTNGQKTMSNSSPVVLASDQSALQILAGWSEWASLTVAAVNNDLLASTDMSSYSEISIQITGTWSGTLTVQYSNDGSTFTSGLQDSTSSGTGTQVNTITSNGIYRILRKGRYVRVRATAWTSGTANATAEGWGLPTGPTSGVSAAQSGTWTVGANSATGSAVPANAFYMAGVNTSGNLTGIATIDRPGDAASGSAIMAEGIYGYNGTTFDRLRTANGVNGTTGTGLLGAGAMVWDGTNWRRAIGETSGQQVVSHSKRADKVQQTTTITSSIAETTVLTAVASTYLDVYGVIIANTSATACEVTFKDATAGTTRFTVYVPAGDTRGFMVPASDGYNQSAVNGNWTATCGTSVASIKITMFAVKNT